MTVLLILLAYVVVHVALVVLAYVVGTKIGGWW
jgi:hypothetical protein